MIYVLVLGRMTSIRPRCSPGQMAWYHNELPAKEEGFPRGIIAKVTRVSRWHRIIHRAERYCELCGFSWIDSSLIDIPIVVGVVVRSCMPTYYFDLAWPVTLYVRLS